MKQTLLFVIIGLLGYATLSAQDNCGNCDVTPNTQLEVKDQLTIKGAYSDMLTLFPNPATDYIGLRNASDVVQVNIFNLIGRKVKSFSYHGNKMDITDLPLGIYLVQLLDGNKKIVATKRVNKK